MRQAERFNWNQQKQNPQFVFPVEPSQNIEAHQTFDPFMLPPSNKLPTNQRTTSDHQPSGDRGRGRGRGPPRETRNFFCHFHGNQSDPTTNHCPEKKKTLEWMEAEKKAKMVRHTAWAGPSAPPYPPATQLYNPNFQPTLAFTYNPYPNNWPSQLPTFPKHHPYLRANSRLKKNYPHPHRVNPQNRKPKVPKLANPSHYQPSA